MSVTQYIAIRTVIDYEIQINKKNVVLVQVVEILLNRNEDFSDEEREQISKSVETIAATAAGGIAGASLTAVTAGLLGGLVGLPLAAFGGVAASTVWLSKIIKDKNKK